MSEYKIVDVIGEVPKLVDGLPLERRQIQDNYLALGISALCKEDKEQLNRVESLLERLLVLVPQQDANRKPYPEVLCTIDPGEGKLDPDQVAVTVRETLSPKLVGQLKRRCE